MGYYSGIDMEQKYNSPFEEDGEQPIFSMENAQTVPPVPQNTAATETTKTEDEKAHEAAEAKRKADWEVRQQQKKESEQRQLNRVAQMSDEDVMRFSMIQVSSATEKITRRNMKECVSEYIQTMCLDNPDFARKVLHPRKTMIRCFQYINRQAWDYVQDELKASGVTPGRGQTMYSCDVPDDLCYQWAADYFHDPDAKEDQEDEEKFIPKPYTGKQSKPTRKAKEKAKKAKPEDDSGQVSLLGVA